MAKFFPDINRTRVMFASRAEEHFYQACRTALGSNWRVFYSVTLSALEGATGLKDNEVDFILYHPRYGVFVIEVKGGRIRFDKATNNFFSINRLGQEFAIKNPFQQILNIKSRMIRQFKDKHIRVPLTQIVCFPNVLDQDIPETSSIERELVIGREKLANLEMTLKDIANKVHPEKYLHFDDVGDRIEEVLIGNNFSTKLFLQDYIGVHESRLRDIEYAHDTLITPIASRPRLAIEGEAGTGKTLLAINLAKHFEAFGQKVLILSSNELLNDHIRSAVGAKIAVQSYLEIGRQYEVDLLNSPKSYTGTREDWIQLEAPDRVMKAMKAQNTSYDVIICDEGQDVQPFWWDIIEGHLVDQRKNPRLYILFDRSQGIFGSGSAENSFIPDNVLPVEGPYFPLVNNYRTTREIATFARAFRTGKQVLESHTSRLGYIPQVITYKNKDDAKAKVELLVRSLIRQEGLTTKDITILSARRPHQEPSVIAGATMLDNIPLSYLQLRNQNPEGIKASTVAGFKGLETNIGILLNFSEYNMPLTNPIMASLLYVAATRAKHMLYIFVQEQDQKRSAIETAIKKIRLTGGVVIDQHESDHEFIGKVVHYNPQRIGWLSVEDPRFPQGNIMFFPTDVERAKLPDFKVGDQLKFRPRTEGKASFACDLILIQGDAS